MSRLPARLARALALNKGRTPALAIPGSDFALAVVQTVYDDGTMDVTFDGGSTTTNIQAMSTFLPAAGQTVLCAVFGTSVYAIGVPGSVPAWIGMAGSYATGWKDTGGVQQIGQYRRMGDRIEIRGVFSFTGTIAAGASSVVFTLPVGYRPTGVGIQNGGIGNQNFNGVVAAYFVDTNGLFTYLNFQANSITNPIFAVLNLSFSLL